MEVHAHSHTSRKKWTHYFWEFLMLFLAVFCGFLAEYQLEHMIEKDREKQYMQSLVEDLSVDTSMINQNYEDAQIQKNLGDSILDLLYNHQPLKNDAIARLYTFHFSYFVIGVDFEDRTKSQLKNSGAMRLIRKKNVSDSMLFYWKRSEAVEFTDQRITEIGNDISSLAAKIFHTKYLIPGDEALAAPKGIMPGAKLIDNEAGLIDQYANRQYTRKRRIGLLMDRLPMLKARAIRLMELIKKEYHLE